MAPPILRFAPSPTGRIHPGNARTALYNWFFAQKHGGTFILRFDDTDETRSTAEYADAIAEDLAWLGIEPDRVERQSARIALYEAAAEKLKERGLLYPCYDTSEELERQRKRRLARGLPPVYDRRALKLTEDDRTALEAEGKGPHWRFLLPNFSDDPFAPERTDKAWDDVFRGPQHVDLASLSDPVMIREDGTFLYTFCSVVDDRDMAVSHVIRGDDHVTNTGVQLALFEALGAEPPCFGHHNLLQTEAGEGFSKRYEALSLMALRRDGIEALALAAYTSLIGTGEAVQPVASLSELVALFDPKKVNRAGARFSVGELKALNSKTLAELPYEAVAERLQEAKVGGGEAFWLAVRGNVEKLADAALWWQVVTGPMEPVIEPEDAEFLREAAGKLPEEPWDETTWGEWTERLKKETGRRGKALFMPLRRALTGFSAGPELRALLPFVGRPNTTARLCGSCREQT
ncbi:glutamate--tRNA ligase [Afifella sp. IM 167]|uniref:glutamate--tRNA ligase n=1 Tax=Afifella sp. IM 167 TaxID=2033586 RepID=UPI001CCBE3FC|nr:glutamate--tRNA ligase [Afifella sp. IM 167]MBZ8134193.1 glutamate--tRNA ligase [Afifella sp. IM 167]